MHSRGNFNKDPSPQKSCYTDKTTRQKVVGYEDNHTLPRKFGPGGETPYAW